MSSIHVQDQSGLLADTFNTNSSRLPSLAEVRRFIPFNYDGDKGRKSFLDFYPSELVKSSSIRENYTKHSWCILSDDFLNELRVKISTLFNRQPVVADICAGGGWLTYWLQRYGVNVRYCIDNYSWSKVVYNSWVSKGDAIQFVRQIKDVDLFILSWPYMDDVAYKVVRGMKKGKYLLYIGESAGGCNANDKFFQYIDKHCSVDDTVCPSFRSFYGIHDSPWLIYKR